MGLFEAVLSYIYLTLTHIIPIGHVLWVCLLWLCVENQRFLGDVFDPRCFLKTLW